MINNLNQLCPDEALLGEQSTPPRAAFPGGVEGVKQCLTSKSEEERIAALSKALNYGQPGKELVFQIVKTETGPVQWVAYDLLYRSANEKARQKLLKYQPLRSQVGVDYTRLRELLATGQWEKADKETQQVMLKAAGREKEGLLDRESIETFPSEDLRTIDQLWVKYSNGHFGFSVQKRIWESVVGNQNTDTETSGHHRFEAHIGEDVNQYGDSLRDSFASRVGWRVQGEWLYYRDLTFNICAPEGHLPSPSFATPCLGREEEEHGVLGRWCAAFCFGSLRCGVLFLGWWSLLERQYL
jgi:hypothetical protein